MVAEFKLYKSGKHGLSVVGLELDSGSYLDEDAIVQPYRTYKYSQSATLNVIFKVSPLNIKVQESCCIIDHRNYPIDSNVFQLSKDGLYEVVHVILPTSVWLTDIINNHPEQLKEYDTIYYVDLDSDTPILLEYLKDGSSKPVIIDNIVNIESGLNTVVKQNKNTFHTGYLEDCFYNINKDIFNILAGDRCAKFSSEEFTYKRDILWMVLNMINYCKDTHQLFEAQKLLDRAMKCNILCFPLLKTGGNNCGCS